jgi:hypothetical protein
MHYETEATKSNLSSPISFSSCGHVKKTKEHNSICSKNGRPKVFRKNIISCTTDFLQIKISSAREYNPLGDILNSVKFDKVKKSI